MNLSSLIATREASPIPAKLGGDFSRPGASSPRPELRGRICHHGRALRASDQHRQLHDRAALPDEDVVFRFVQMRSPERHAGAVHQIMQTCKNGPVESIKFFRRVIRMTKCRGRYLALCGG